MADTPTLEALRQCRDALQDALSLLGAYCDEAKQGRAALAAADAALTQPERHLTVTTNAQGEAVLVSWQDAEHRILETVWERDAALSVPAGWMLAPAEPTHDMVKAGRRAFRDGLIGSVSDAYRAMLAAAPQPTPAALSVQAEPDMRHPKIQALIGSNARRNIELSLVEQLIENPGCDLTAMDMEYWNGMHDRLRDALLKAAAPRPEPVNAQMLALLIECRDFFGNCAGYDGADTNNLDTRCADVIATAEAAQPEPAAAPFGYVFGNSFWEATNPRITDDVKRHGRPLYANPTPQPPAPVPAVPDHFPDITKMVAHSVGAKGLPERVRECIAAILPHVRKKFPAEQALDELAALASRPAVDADKRDAERYRWLRSVGGKTWTVLETGQSATGDLYDAAVDAARHPAQREGE